MKISLAATATLLHFAVPFTSAWTTIPLPATTVHSSSSSPLSTRNPSTLHVGLNIENTDPNERSVTMVEVGPALNLNRHLKRITSLITSVAGLIVTLAAISTQPVMTLLGGSISSTIAWIITLAAFYYATSIGFGWVIVVFSLFCASIGVMGPPITFLQSLIGPTLPEPRVEYVDPNYVAKSTPKKNLLARIQNSICRLPFRIILFILAITDTF